MQEAARAEIGILGGTGLYDMPGLEGARDVEIETPYGKPSAAFRVGSVEGREVAFLARHGRHHQLLPSEIPYRANVWALKSLGVEKVISPSAVGSLRESLPPRRLVVPSQIIDRTRHRPDSFFGEGIVVHVSLADPYSETLRRILILAGEEVGCRIHDGGTYLCMEGPQFSTRAESQWYRSAGCDVIGMTSVTEARLCREAEIAYVSISMVTDYDAWRVDEAGVTAEEIVAVLRDNADDATKVVRAAIPKIPRGSLPENTSLETAILTPLDAVPAATLERLAPLLARVRSRA